jgi:hypothetical protein
MALDPLKNPMERLKSLPTMMALRKNPADNLPYWDVAIQYYVNDVVLSEIDEGAYVMSGAGDTLEESAVAVRGGPDPANDTDGNWVALAPSGVGKSNWFQSGVTLTPVTANAITVAGGALVRSAVGTGRTEVWLATLNTTSIGPAAAAGDGITFTFTPQVAGAAVAVSLPLRVGATTSGLSASAVVSLPATSTGATLVASWQGTQPTSMPAATLVWVRIA